MFDQSADVLLIVLQACDVCATVSHFLRPTVIITVKPSTWQDENCTRLPAAIAVADGVNNASATLTLFASAPVVAIASIVEDD